MKKARVKVLRNDEQQIENKLVLKEEKVYVLKNKELRLEIIWLYHDTLIARHRGQQKMVELWRKLKYLVRQKDYIAEKDTWEGLENLGNTIDLV